MQNHGVCQTIPFRIMRGAAAGGGNISFKQVPCLLAIAFKHQCRAQYIGNEFSFIGPIGGHHVVQSGNHTITIPIAGSGNSKQLFCLGVYMKDC